MVGPQALGVVLSQDLDSEARCNQTFRGIPQLHVEVLPQATEPKVDCFTAAVRVRWACIWSEGSASPCALVVGNFMRDVNTLVVNLIWRYNLIFWVRQRMMGNSWRKAKHWVKITTPDKKVASLKIFWCEYIKCEEISWLETMQMKDFQEKNCTEQNIVIDLKQIWCVNLIEGSSCTWYQLLPWLQHSLKLQFTPFFVSSPWPASYTFCWLGSKKVCKKSKGLRQSQAF